MSTEHIIPRKHTLKFLCKSKHFPRTYKRKHEWVFFSEHSVYRQTFSVAYDIDSRKHSLYCVTYLILNRELANLDKREIAGGSSNVVFVSVEGFDMLIPND